MVSKLMFHAQIPRLAAGDGGVQLLGLPDDGPFVGGWLGAKLDGPAWVTGGEFGIETSLIAIALCLAVASWVGLHIH